MVEINKIYHCGCLELMEKMENDFLHLIFTSVPYYNAREYSQYDSVAHYMAEMKAIFTECHRVLQRSRMCVINISPVLVERESRSEQSYRIPLPFYFVPMMEEIGFEFLEDIIWRKPAASVPNRNGGFFVHRKPVAYKPNILTEYVLVFKKKSDFLIDEVLRNNSLVTGEYERTNVWEISPITNSEHSAAMPERLAENIIRYYSYENDEIVYDPFCGSATTLRVASALKRKWIGSEINDEYFKLAQRRMSGEVHNLFT